MSDVSDWMLLRSLLRAAAYGCAFIGIFCLTLGVLGGLLERNARPSYRYVDPREPVSLIPGRYPVEWLGPAKGPRPFSWDLRVEVMAHPDGAVWHQPSSEAVIPTGDPFYDMARSAVGTLVVDQPTTVSVVFNPSVPTQGGPRLRIPQGTRPGPATRSGLLIAVGAGFSFCGMMLLGLTKRAS